MKVWDFISAPPDYDPEDHSEWFDISELYENRLEHKIEIHILDTSSYFQPDEEFDLIEEYLANGNGFLEAIYNV